jgi:TolB-like protein/ketosteroid isomerase-like protein
VKHEGDGFMATFTTAHCMVECGFAVQQEFLRRGWHVRLGGHYGDVYRNEAGDVIGAVVNRAARIQSTADAAHCQFLVSDVVQARVRNRIRHIRFGPHPAVVAKGIPEPLTVFEVEPVAGPVARVATQAPGPPPTTPPPPAVAARSYRRQWAVVGSVALAALVVPLALWYLHSGSARDARPPSTLAAPDAANTIAVMEFENQRSDDAKDDWYCKALQTTFNTELSKIPQLSVIAPEIIQRVAKEGGLDRMAAARRLGVSRFITGSFAVLGSTIRMDARIVDPANGLQETAENVEGVQDEFFSLQKKLALATLDHLRVRLTDAQTASFKKTTNSRLDKYRMLLGAEGMAGPAPAPDVRPPADSLQPRGELWPPPSQRSWAIDFHLLHAAMAQAPATDAERAARAVLEEYRQAQERGDLDRLASLYVSFPPSQRQKIDAYVKDAAKLRVDFVDVKILPRANDLAVSYTRRDNFIDKDTGEPVSLEVRVTKFLVQDGGTWKFAAEGQ